MFSLCRCGLFFDILALLAWTQHTRVHVTHWRLVHAVFNWLTTVMGSNILWNPNQELLTADKDPQIILSQMVQKRCWLIRHGTIVGFLWKIADVNIFRTSSSHAALPPSWVKAPPPPTAPLSMGISLIFPPAAWPGFDRHCRCAYARQVVLAPRCALMLWALMAAYFVSIAKFFLFFSSVCLCTCVHVYGVLVDHWAGSRSISDSNTQLGVQKWGWALVAGEMLGHFQKPKKCSECLLWAWHLSPDELFMCNAWILCNFPSFGPIKDSPWRFSMRSIEVGNLPCNLPSSFPGSGLTSPVFIQYASDVTTGPVGTV